MPPLRIFSKWFEVAGRTYDAVSNSVLAVMSRVFFTLSFDVMIYGVQSFGGIFPCGCLNLLFGCLKCFVLMPGSFLGC